MTGQVLPRGSRSMDEHDLAANPAGHAFLMNQCEISQRTGFAYVDVDIAAGNPGHDRREFSGIAANFHADCPQPASSVVPSSLRLAGQADVQLAELAELADEEMILGKPGDVLRETMEDYFRQVGTTPRVVCEADEAAAVEDYVAAGLGVAFISGLLKPTPRHVQTAWVLIIDPACVLTLGIAWNQDRYLSLEAQAMQQHVFALLEATNPESVPGD